MTTYTTVLGDTFDKIALEQLGSEYLLPLLLQENQNYRDVLIFSAGVEIIIPDTDLDEYEAIPDWLIGDEEEGYLSDGDEEYPLFAVEGEA